jgi:alginate O-acetyltransferase complex protein AlgI
MLLAGLFSFWKFRSYDWCVDVSFKKSLVVLGLFILATLALFTQSYNPFLYFQF